MEQFCEDLRNAREQRDITLETISGITKVSPRYLHALETGHFDYLPGGVFRKGILRGYLDAIGVDPTPWVHRFELLLADSGASVPIPPEAIDQFAENVRRNRPHATVADRGRWVGVAVTFLILVALCSFLWIFALHGHVSL